MPKPTTRKRTVLVRARGAQLRNRSAKTHGFYSSTFTPKELALLATFVEDPTLDDEIWMQRVLNHRLMAYTQGQDDAGVRIPLDLVVKIAEALATGTGRVARLLRDRQALSGTANDRLTLALATVLEETGAAIGRQL